MENIMVLGEITNFDQNMRIPPPHPQIQKIGMRHGHLEGFLWEVKTTGNVIGHIPPIYIFSEFWLILLLQDAGAARTWRSP